MQNTCIGSTFQLRCKGPLSFSFNDYSCCLNDRLDRNPFLYSSSSSSCCSCCANSLYSRFHISSPSYLYGLRQSNLIQWSPYKKLILNGLDRFNSSRFQILDVGRSCYCEKDYIFKERKSGKGAFRRMAFEEKSEWDGFCDGRDGFDEVESMLNLLSEDVSDKLCSVRERRGKSSRKIEVEKRGNSGDSNVRRRKKNGDLGVVESRSKFEYEEKVIRSKEGKMRQKDRGEKVRGALLRRENVRIRAKKDERDNLLREEKVKEEERRNLLRENTRERVKVEDGENLSSREDHRQRARKDGSSCSSYYSFSSGGFEIDNEAQDEQEDFEGEVSRGYTSDTRRNEVIVSDEVLEEYQRHADYSKEKGDVLRKENTQMGFSGASSAVESDWRKKSEKRLTDVSIGETKSSKELAEKQSRYREVQESGYGETVGSYSRFDDKNKQSTLAVKFDKGTREQHRQAHESETTMKSKQFTEMSEARVADTKTSSASGKLYNSRDESSSKFISSDKKKGEHHIAASHISKADEYRHNSSKLAEVSKIQEMDIRGTSSAVRQSEITMKKQGDYSNMSLTSINNREEQYHHAGQTSSLLDSRGKYHLVTQNVDSESTLVSKRETDTRMEKQEAKSSSIYKSDLELRDQLEMTTKDNIGVSVVADGKERTSIVTEPPSQLVVSVSIHGELASGSATEQMADERLHSGFTASHEHSANSSDQAHGEPLKFISHEDALSSADRLQKSSAHYVGEYVQKVRDEISTSELQEVKKTYETKLMREDEQQSKESLNSYSSTVSQSKEQDSRRLSRSSGIKGPSDEIWDVAEPSTQEHPETGRIENESNNGNAVVKRTGKSLWNIIGDIVRLRWASRSEHGSTAKSGGKSSPNQSTSSETWFSALLALPIIAVAEARNVLKLPSEAADFFQPKESNGAGDDSVGTRWAVLVAGSSGYWNYRHQADVCHAYQILKRGGLKDENIVVFMYDDIAYDEENPRPGVIINSPHGDDVYKGVPKDYTGDDVTAKNFLAALLGNKTAITGGSGKVVDSGPNDHIFIYYTDHGGPGVLGMPSGPYLYANDLIEVLKKKHASGTYKSLVFYLEACESGSIFEGLLPEGLDIYATTASNAEESSWGTYCPGENPSPPPEYETCLGDLYSVAWMEDSEIHNLRTETLKQQYHLVKERTSNGNTVYGSHVMQYGDLKLSVEDLFLYMGTNPANDNYTFVDENSLRLSSKAVNQRDADLVHFWDKFRKAPEDSARKVEAQKQVVEAMSHRMHIDNSIKLIGKLLFGFEKGPEILETVRPAGQHLADDWDCLKSLVRTFETHCGSLSQYGMKHMRSIANICNAGIKKEQMAEAAAQACISLPSNPWSSLHRGFSA